MFQDSDGVFGGIPDPREIEKLMGIPRKQAEEKGYQPCGDIQGGYQPPGDGLTIEDFDMPTIYDTLEGDDGGDETD